MFSFLLTVLVFGIALSETVAGSCSKNEWRCSDGSCISSGSRCDAVVDCGDGSDEEHCRKTRAAKDCVYPEYPNDKTYFDTDVENARTGEIYPGIFINVTCQEGYGVNGSSEFVCIRGRWIPSNKISECVRHCYLLPNPAVEYQCILTGSNFGLRPCNEYELEGTEVIPTCRGPTYYAPLNLQYMRCQNGKWLHEPICIPDCGTVTPVGNQLIIDGTISKRGEMPWHAGIYDKRWDPYRQICGGSIISTRIVISAAHCFWDENAGKQQPADKYAVAVGKLYRPWNDTHDESQHSDVKELHLSDHYKGSATHHQDDIAIVIVATPFEYKLHIRPICMDFEVIFQSMQLKPGSIGKVAGWGLTAADGISAPILQVLDMPYISIDTCFADSPYEFRPFLTSDKFCAGLKKGGKALCQGDSGGGLAFSGSHLRGTERYFLRGITSTASNTKNLKCNPDTYTAFTLIQKHEHFIKRYWVGVDDYWRSSALDSEQPSLANCIMPNSDNITTYKAMGMPHAAAGRGYVSIQLEVTCAEGYALDSFDALSKFNCFNGTWLPSQTLPKCAAHCRLPNKIGTDYDCKNPTQKSEKLNIDCVDDNSNRLNDVPSGTVVTVRCMAFYRLNIWKSNVLVCDNGLWDNNNVTHCVGECGVASSSRKSPWFAGIYSKESKPYKYMCAGTLISESVVLSAANCFWSEGELQSPDKFAVQVLTEGQAWDPTVRNSRRSDVMAVYVPDDFQEKATSCQDDVAVLVLRESFLFWEDIRPACIDEYSFVKSNLPLDSTMKIATWDEDGMRDVISFPYKRLADFDNNITCTSNTTYICSADGGTGLLFPEIENNFFNAIKETTKYHLRGITSYTPSCNSSYITWLEDRERTFIEKVLNENSHLDISIRKI